MKEDKQTILIVLLVINAVLILYFGTTFNRNQKSNHSMLISQINNINNTVSYLDSSITQRIQNMLDAKENMIASADYEYVNIDTANNKASIDLTVQLKAVSADSKIYLAYSEIDKSSHVQEIELAKKEGLSFGAKFELDLDKNYQYDVIERVDGAGEALLNNNQQNIFLYDRFYRMRVLMDSSGSGRNNQQINFDYIFSVDDFGIDDFGLEHVMLEVFSAGRLIDQIDVTDKLESRVHNNLKEHYNMAVASGQIDTQMVIEEFIEHMEYADEEKINHRTYYFLTHTIDYDTDYPELELNNQKAENLYANLIITCKDGYESEG